MTNSPTMSPGYSAWLSDVKSRIQSARISVARAVNRELILLCWDIGRGIVEKQDELGWGKSVVERPAFDLKAAFPVHHGFSPSNPWRMHQFCRVFTAPEFLAQAVRELRGTRDLEHASSIARLNQLLRNDYRGINVTMIPSDTPKCRPSTRRGLETPLLLPGPVDCRLAAAMSALAPSLPMDSIL